MGTEEPERKILESEQTGTSVKAPGQLRLPRMEIQQTSVDSCKRLDGSLELGGISPLQASIYRDEHIPQTNIEPVYYHPIGAPDLMGNP